MITPPRTPLFVRVVSRDARHSNVKAEFRCECGAVFTAFVNNVRRGATKSCGCYNAAVARRRSLKHGESYAVGKKPASREYSTWASMKRRCLKPACKEYPYYGGRGIKVCERWMGDSGYLNFLSDMGRCPSPAHSIERINNDGDYAPSNCRWATDIEQANNKSNNRRLTIDGVTRTVSEWARISGILAATIKTRLRNYGWDAKQAVFEPLRPGWAKTRHLRYS